MSAATYIAIYYYFLLAFTIVVCLMNVKSCERYRGILTFVLLSFVFVHIGFRPLDPLFGDTRTYAREFNEMCQYHSFEARKDFFFYYISLLISRITQSTTVYFCILGLSYILPVLFALKKRLPQTYFLVLFAYVCSFSFWGYGVNGLRNGLGVSFFLLALLSDKKIIQLLFIAVSIAFHTSLALPVIALFIAKYLHGNPKTYNVLWLICLLASLIAGHSIGDYLGSISFINGIDERMSGYLTLSTDDMSDITFNQQGFRWDFVLYSSIPIIVGGYYIYNKKYEDSIYKLLYCIYLLCNAFWLLTIYVPFNNRFAYLSWFLHPILLTYPLVTSEHVVRNRNSILHWTLFLNYLFTFIMWLR